MDTIEPPNEPFEPSPEPFEPSSEQISLAHDKADELERAAQKIGLYQQGFRLGVTSPDETGTARMVIIADFIPGDVAWSPRVQDPDSAAVNEQFRTIQSDLEAEDFEAYRDQLARRLEDED